MYIKNLYVYKVEDFGIEIKKHSADSTYPNFYTQEGLLVDRNAILLKRVSEEDYCLMQSPYESFNSSYLSEDNLIPLERIINRKGLITKKQAIKNFNDKLKARFSIYAFHVGDIAKIVEESRSDRSAKISLSLKTVKENALLLRVGEDMYTDLESFKTYPKKSKNVDDLVVVNCEYLNDFLSDRIIPSADNININEIPVYRALDNYREQVKSLKKRYYF